MLDATEDYLTAGGRLIYAGGNGYYWVSGLRAGEPHCMEVRKLDTGSRAWQAEAGEGYLACTGERSGLWRSRGRAPQKIVGVGFTSEGMDESQCFERMPDSFHRRVAWMFEGVGPQEKIGDFGLGLNGAFLKPGPLPGAAFIGEEKLGGETLAASASRLRRE